MKLILSYGNLKDSSKRPTFKSNGVVIADGAPGLKLFDGFTALMGELLILFITKLISSSLELFEHISNNIQTR